MALFIGFSSSFGIVLLIGFSSSFGIVLIIGFSSSFGILLLIGLSSSFGIVLLIGLSSSFGIVVSFSGVLVSPFGIVDLAIGVYMNKQGWLMTINAIMRIRWKIEICKLYRNNICLLFFIAIPRKI